MSENSSSIAANMQWTTVGDMVLYDEHRQVLESDGWLNDKHINAFQVLLKKQHPHISGLQNTLLQETNCFDVLGSDLFIQCLNLSSNPWITVPTVDGPPHTVRVFDRLNLRLSSSLIKLIADMTNTTSSTIWVSMQTCTTRQVGVTVGCLPLHLLVLFVIKEIPYYWDLTRSQWGSIWSIVWNSTNLMNFLPEEGPQNPVYFIIK